VCLQRTAGVRPHGPAAVLIDSITDVIRFARFEAALKEVYTESAKQTKAELKTHVGGFYMHYHAIGFGPSVQLEDAQAALKAYWRICEKRINEDVEGAVDMMLLQRCSEIIETTLLSKVQEWLADDQQLQAMMSEDPKVIEERIHLKLVNVNVKAALEKLDEIIPGCIPRSPFTYKRTIIAEKLRKKYQHAFMGYTENLMNAGLVKSFDEWCVIQ
jgi:hypothetical protein